MMMSIHEDDSVNIVNAQDEHAFCIMAIRKLRSADKPHLNGLSESQLSEFEYHFRVTLLIVFEEIAKFDTF